MDERQLFLPFLPRHIDPARAAEVLRVSHSTVLRLCQQRKIPGAQKFFGRWRIDTQQFHDWIEELKKQGIRV